MEVDVELPAEAAVEGLGAVDVGDRQRGDLESHWDGPIAGLRREDVGGVQLCGGDRARISFRGLGGVRQDSSNHVRIAPGEVPGLRSLVLPTGPVVP